MTEMALQLCETTEKILDFMIKNRCDVDRLEEEKLLLRAAVDKQIEEGREFSVEEMEYLLTQLLKGTIEKDVKDIFNFTIEGNILSTSCIKELIVCAEKFNRKDMLLKLQKLSNSGEIEKIRKMTQNILNTMAEYTDDKEFQKMVDELEFSEVKDDGETLSKLKEYVLSLYKEAIKNEYIGLLRISFVDGIFNNGDIKELIKYASKFNNEEVIVELCNMISV